MNTKLTLRINEELIRSAKKQANSMGKSVSQLVADYFYLLDRQVNEEHVQLTPIVKSLKGVLKNSQIDEDDYKSYLEDKYL